MLVESDIVIEFFKAQVNVGLALEVVQQADDPVQVSCHPMH